MAPRRCAGSPGVCGPRRWRGSACTARWLATAFAEQARVPVDRWLQSDVPLSPEEELVVCRVAPEALTNVIRHAQASRVELELVSRDVHTELTVRDDGRGLAPG